MNYIKKTITLSLLVVFSLSIQSCTEEPAPPEEGISVVGIAIENNFTVLANALNQVGLLDDLQGAGPFTIFAPTDEAFNAAGITVQNLDSIVGLENILLYHILAGSVTSDELIDGQVTMWNGRQATIEISTPSINGAAIISPLDVIADNGVVHTIDQVLLPPSDIVQTAINEGYNVLAAGLSASGLASDLQGAGPFTLFAPSDAAFNGAGITEDNIASLYNLDEILAYHVVSGELRSSQLSSGDILTLNGQSIAIDQANLTVNGNSIQAPFDITTSNGVIHTLDGVLLPELDVTAISRLNGYDLFASSLQKFPDLAAMLEDLNSTYTVFIPTNAAFLSLLEVIGQNSIDDISEDVLRNILELHIHSAEVPSSNFSDQLILSTLNGEDLTLTDNGGSFLINDAQINTLDISLVNGVAHVLDEVLVPTSVLQYLNTVLEPVFFNKNFTKLFSGIEAADPSIMTALLDVNASLTLFAPSNRAFDEAGIDDLSARADLNDILGYHVLTTEVSAADLPVSNIAAPESVNTFGGESLYISNRLGLTGVYLNGNTRVLSTDINQLNGTVHIIDKALIPPSADIVALAQEKGFSELAAALVEAGLVTSLQGNGPFTVFAPTNEAFQALYTSLGVSDATGVEDQLLLDVLNYHVLGLRAFSTDLNDGLEATTLEGSSLTINLGSNVTIADGNADTSDATVTAFNFMATNGAIHVIDEVLLPN